MTFQLKFGNVFLKRFFFEKFKSKIEIYLLVFGITLICKFYEFVNEHKPVRYGEFEIVFVLSFIVYY